MDTTRTGTRNSGVGIAAHRPAGRQLVFCDGWLSAATTPGSALNTTRSSKRPRTRHARNPCPPVHLYIGTNFAVRLFHNFRFQRHVTNSNERGFVWMQYESCRHVTQMELSEGARKIHDLPNAGGNSVHSEVLSFEVLHRCFGATLLKTEMEVAYYPEGGSITDYTCLMFGTRLGVSVTRAMKFRGDFEAEDAEKLLQKKLKGIVNSTRNSLEKWSKQLLHIWAIDSTVANQIARAYSTMPRHLTTNTVVLVTTVRNGADRLAIFF